MKNQITKRDYELLSAYLDNQVSDKERRYIESRLNTIPELRKELHELSKTRLMLHQMPKLRAPHNYFINPKVVPVPTTIPRGMRLAPTMGIISAVSTILLVLMIFGQNLLTPAGPVALAPAVQAPIESTSVEQEVERNAAESALVTTEEAPMALMEAPQIPSPEPTDPSPTEDIFGTLLADETQVATPTTIYLYALPPTATPTPESTLTILEMPAGGGLLTCEDYFTDRGDNPPPDYLAGCPTPTGTDSGGQLNSFLAGTQVLTSTATTTATPTHTSTPTNTATPTPTETPTPTATPSPTDTPIAPLAAAPAMDSGEAPKSPPATEIPQAQDTVAAVAPAEESVPAEQAGQDQNLDFTHYLVLVTELSLATIAVGSGLTALILRLRAGR